MQTRLNNNELDQLSDYLIGSSRSLEEGIRALGYVDIDMVSIRDLEDRAFQCRCCGFWQPISNLDGNDICGQCSIGEESGPLYYEDEIMCSDFGSGFLKNNEEE